MFLTHAQRALRSSFVVVALLVGLGPLSAQTAANCPNGFFGENCDERLNTITTAVPFLLISPDSRAGGMGDAGVAISPDVNSIHWNPSKLAFAEDEMEVGISYTPWLRNLVPDMSMTYLSLYKKVGKLSTIGGSLRYFSLGSITFTDINGTVLRDFKPTEFAVDLAFAQKFSDRFSGGVAIRYVNSNLTGGIAVGAGAVGSKAGQSVAADVSFFYTNPDMQVAQKDATFNFGLNVSNIGAKMSYTETAKRDFIPINLRLGPALTLDLDEYNKITFQFDANKLLVPTPPIYAQDSAGAPLLDPETNEFVIASGSDPDVGVAAGIFNSFGDAPGTISTDEDGDPIYDANGNAQVESGSKFKEELREINLSGGIEYWYANQFAVRAGYFHEHFTKGNRQYFTMGAGVRYSIFALDFSYLIATSQQSPLANTLRFTLKFTFDDLKGKKKEGDVE